MSAVRKFKVGDLVRFANRAQNSPGPMRINRIVDGKIYVGSEFFKDDDGLAWCAGNFILDSEWKDMHDERPLYQKLGLPLVERGYPMPPARPKRKYTPRAKRISKWIGFLKDLKHGDSFLLGFPDVTTMKHYAAKLGITLRWKLEPETREDGKPKWRYWRA
jgi:hypothetical protein